MSRVGPVGLSRSSTLRLSLLYLVLLLASVAALFSFFYWSTTASIARQIDAAIDTEVEGLRDRYLANGFPGLRVLITNRVGRNPDKRTLYLLADRNYQPIAGNLSTWPEALGRETTAGGALRELTLSSTEGDPTEREQYLRLRTFSLRKDFGLLMRDDFFLLVGRDAKDLAHLREQMRFTFAWGLAGTLVVGAFSGFWISRRFAQRIEQINAASRGVMGGDLSVRIPEPRRSDDLGEIARHFNRMLDQIETLMAGVRQVSDNIAHDLRTPLARLRNELEAAHAAAGDDAKDTRLQLERAIEEADALLSTFSALLRIARIEAGERRAGFARVELSALLSDVVELYEPLAEERNQALKRTETGRAFVSGDRDLLFQAVANLVDNAVKYSPEGAVITLELLAEPGAEAGHPAIVVTDRGPGIAADDRPRVLDRFFRVEASRSQPGNGLGLSLVAAVAKLHGAELRLDDADPGLRVSMMFSPKEQSTGS